VVHGEEKEGLNRQQTPEERQEERHQRNLVFLWRSLLALFWRLLAVQSLLHW
jgi:hypothetical protein